MWVHQTRVDMVTVAFSIADTDMVNFSKLANRLPQAANAITSLLLDVKLLDNLVERAQDLHVSELCIAVQELESLLCLRLAILLDQVLQDKTHAADLLSYVLFGLTRHNIAVKEVLSDWIDTIFGRPWHDFFLHSPLILSISPKWQSQVDSIIHVHHSVLPKLKLADEPL